MAETQSKSKNWLLIKFREWHTWLGVAVSLVVVVVAATGIYLNHKDLFRPAKPKGERHEAKKSPPVGLLQTSTRQANLPLTFDDALQLVQNAWGEKTVERIELKEHQGEIVYLVKAADGAEVLIDLQSRELKAKTAPNDWGKILKDLHTGKIGGLFGKLLVDGTSLVLIVLTGTGIYLWLTPLLRKRRGARERAAVALAKQALGKEVVQPVA
jgi:hypothetical protein